MIIALHHSLFYFICLFFALFFDTFDSRWQSPEVMWFFKALKSQGFTAGSFKSTCSIYSSSTWAVTRSSAVWRKRTHLTQIGHRNERRGLCCDRRSENVFSNTLHMSCNWKHIRHLVCLSWSSYNTFSAERMYTSFRTVEAIYKSAEPHTRAGGQNSYEWKEQPVQYSHYYTSIRQRDSLIAPLMFIS